MKKVRIIKNKKIYFESYFYTSYENKKIIEIDFNDLHDADLHCTDLHNANLSGSNLSNADLHNADLSNADLESTILNEKEAIRKGKIINKKAFIYKKCRGKIVKLELQIGSIVFSINNKKCRTNKAKVISIDGNKKKGLKIASDYDNNFIYEVGKIIEVEDFNLMYNVECETGIHFFWTEEEANEYFE